jgi:XTP/dITP diphosphohydrolase
MAATSQTLIITLASKNEGKRLELSHWLKESGLPIEIALNTEANEVEETGSTFLENALLKAQQTAAVSNSGLVIGEDSGLVIDALDGCYQISPFPGLYSNRWLTPEIRNQLLGQSFSNRMPLDRISETGITNSDLCQGILTLMAGQKNRTARYYCGMVLWHAERGQCFETLEFTQLEVIQNNEPRGHNGFGYDPIMIPVDANGVASDLTMAELSTTDKNRISHRGRAFKKLLAYLQEHHYF